MNRVVALLVLSLALGIHCEFVQLPYTLFTTIDFAPNENYASWVVGEDGNFDVSGQIASSSNYASLLFSTTIEGTPAAWGNSAFRSGSVFQSGFLSITDQTNPAITWGVSASIYLLTHEPIARYVLEFTPVENLIIDAPTLAPRETTNFDVVFRNPQGFPSAWTIITTTSGDNVLTTDDHWVIVQLDGDATIPENIVSGYTLFYFYQNVVGTQRPININFMADDLQFTFSVPVETLETRKLMFFVEFGDSVSELVAGVEKYDQTFNFPPPLIADIPKSELDTIVNFQFVDPISGIPLPATFTNLCKISSEIRDRSSARHPTKKHYFSQPWFC